jgi:hypothetical protein
VAIAGRQLVALGVHALLVGDVVAALGFGAGVGGLDVPLAGPATMPPPRRRPRRCCRRRGRPAAPMAVPTMALPTMFWVAESRGAMPMA